jgi:ComF family protein
MALGTAARWGGQGARLLLDALLPGRCLNCGAIVGDQGALCTACWQRISFIGAPQCDRCGDPFEFERAALGQAQATLCVSCMTDPPIYERARAAFRYDEASRALILRFKHADRTGAAPHFARWMARAGSSLLAEADLLVPVPLHRWRLWRRRYNQAAMLAMALAKHVNRPCMPDALERSRPTPSQGTLGRGQRARNVQGAFRLRRPAAVAGRSVLLVDDVLTSGATIGECARILLRGGARRVDVLTLARVVLTPGFEITGDTLYS